MAIEDKVFSGDTLRVGYRFQRHWDNSMAYAFCCAEFGAGLFFVSLLLENTIGMVLGLAVMHLMFLHGGWHGSPGARTSVELLLQTLYARWFWGLVVVVGLALPALILWAAPASKVLAIVSALATLAGFLAWRILIFKIGVYEPIMSMNPFQSAG